MKDLREWLELADPVGYEPAASDVDVQQMRRLVMAAAREENARSPLRSMQWAVAGLVIAIFCGFTAVRWTQPIRFFQSMQPGMTAADSFVTAPRQLHFVTPGGTRVVWVFNPEFEARSIQ
jgi:hypothetical protein